MPLLLGQTLVDEVSGDADAAAEADEGANDDKDDQPHPQPGEIRITIIIIIQCCFYLVFRFTLRQSLQSRPVAAGWLVQPHIQPAQ